MDKKGIFVTQTHTHNTRNEYRHYVIYRRKIGYTHSHLGFRNLIGWTVNTKNERGGVCVYVRTECELAWVSQNAIGCIVVISQVIKIATLTAVFRQKF